MKLLFNKHEFIGDNVNGRSSKSGKKLKRLDPNRIFYIEKVTNNLFNFNNNPQFWKSCRKRMNKYINEKYGENAKV